jgi:aminoglycoside phosphotransferase (APT) family kinase protein
MTPDPARFERWLRRIPGFETATVTAITPFDGGASNITCRAGLSGAPVPAVVLRLQRERGIFEPYDVLREGEVLLRLAPSSVPVPALLGSEADPAVMGAPFIVMQWLDAPHMGEAGPEADFGAFTEMVARIHAQDWEALGLAVIGVPASPRAGTLAEVEAIAARMPAFGCDADPALTRALSVLRTTAPADGRLALCQGDINIFNYLFRQQRVVAVVDWEQARISDPRSDVGHLVALSHLKGAPFAPAGEMPFVQAYSAAAGSPISGMEYFRALWLFHLGVIHHGWVRFNGTSPWYDRDHLERLLEAAIGELA